MSSSVQNVSFIYHSGVFTPGRMGILIGCGTLALTLLVIGTLALTNQGHLGFIGSIPSDPARAMVAGGSILGAVDLIFIGVMVGQHQKMKKEFNLDALDELTHPGQWQQIEIQGYRIHKLHMFNENLKMVMIKTEDDKGEAHLFADKEIFESFQKSVLHTLTHS